MWQEQKRQAEEQEAQRKQQEEQYLKQLAQTNPGRQKCFRCFLYIIHVYIRHKYNILPEIKYTVIQ